MSSSYFCSFFFNHTATTEIYTLSLHDALPISSTTACGAPSRWAASASRCRRTPASDWRRSRNSRSEEHTSELQSLTNLVCRLLLEKKKKKKKTSTKYIEDTEKGKQQHLTEYVR